VFLLCTTGFITIIHHHLGFFLFFCSQHLKSQLQDDDFVKVMMQRMQQKQKDAVATLAVEGLVGFRGHFLRFFLQRGKGETRSKQDVAKTL